MIRKRKKEEPICGGRTEYYIQGYGDKILSEELISFEYECREFKVQCQKEKDKIHIKSLGGVSNKRDGTTFKLDYFTKGNLVLKVLHRIIKKYHLSKNNGHYENVGGLPPGCGDLIKAEYKSNEKIYKYSNQCPHVPEEAKKEIYDVFLEDAKRNKYDFTTEKSNVQIYDDADEEFLQGTWKGKHFGDEFKVVFQKNHIEIYCNGKKTDDTDYIIIQGDIRKNKLKDGIKEGKDEYDYEEFHDISTIKKKNKITLVAYFMKESYSTADLIKEKENL